MHRTNLEMLQVIASGLAELKDAVVFVGGAVAELYVENIGAAPVRPTLDIDLIINIVSKPEFANLENQLRKLGFANDLSEGAPICRWLYQGIKVDVMPTDTKVLGFSNDRYHKSDENVRRFISESLQEFQENPNYEEALTYALPYGETDRLGLIEKKIKEIMGIDKLPGDVS